jgi:O-antigen ligase
LTQVGATVPPVDLEPSRVAHGIYLSRRLAIRIDVTTVLSLMVMLLLLLPSRLIAPALGQFGRPAVTVALGLAVWWCVVRFSPQLTMTGPQPMRWAALAYLAAVLASYAAGHLRGLPPVEASGADSALIGTAAFLGVAVMTADGVPNRSRLDSLLRTFVWCAAAMALIGLAQYVLQDDITRHINIPGLALQHELVGLRARGDVGFFQIASTATHYIEFSAVMAIALPFAIHFARFAATPGTRQLFIGVSLLIAAAIPIALSRTGMLAAGVVLLAMLPVWSWRLRFNIGTILVGLAIAFMMVRPGLLGTVRSLFTSVLSGEDPSVQGRTDDYAAVYEYFSDRPWLGRGPGTFIPQLYRYLDNQWFGSLIETGLIGVTALAGLHITAIVLARIAWRRAASEVDRHLCAALLAAQLAAIVCAFTFDTLGFASFAIMVMLLAGAAGAMWRLTHPARTVRTAAPRRAGL